MTEGEETSTATVETQPGSPAGETVAETVAPQEEQKPTAPLSKREARAQVHADAKARAEAARPAEEAAAATEKVEATAEGEVKPEAGATTAEGTTAGETGAAKADEAAKPPAPVAIEIELPPGHPIRSMGVEKLVATSPEQERAIRALVNGSYTRRQENERLEKENTDLRREKIERDSHDAASDKWQKSPEYQTAVDQYQKIRDLETSGELPPGSASQFWKGFQADYARLAKQEYDTRMGAVEAEADQRAAEAWKSDAWINANQLPKLFTGLPNFGLWFEEAVQSFEAEIALGHFPQLRTAEDAHREFRTFFGSILTRKQAVGQAYRQLKQEEQTRAAEQARMEAAAKAAADQRLREQGAREGVQSFKQDAAARRDATPPHPLGQVAAASRGRAPANAEGQDIPADASVHTVRKLAKAAAREDARRRFSP